MMSREPHRKGMSVLHSVNWFISDWDGLPCMIDEASTSWDMVLYMRSCHNVHATDLRGERDCHVVSNINV